eukprot:gene9376-gene990
MHQHPSWDLHERAFRSFKCAFGASRIAITAYQSGPYPEGNFGVNQLSDGSMGLSPLNPDLTSDLHVNTVADLHQSFPWLHRAQA